ncbi:MAG: two-component regulator propeller domain-containing protein, partial [Flavobacteriales bacterium]
TTLESELWMPPITSNGNEVVPVRYVAIDDSGACWASVSAYGQGLWRLWNGTWDNFLEANSEMPGDFPQYLFADRAHQKLWVDCVGKGSFDGTDLEPVGAYIGPSTATSNGDLWSAADGVLYRFDGLNTQVYDTANSDLPHHGVYQLAADDADMIWFAMQRFDTINWVGSTTIGTFDGAVWQEYTDTTSVLPLITEAVVDLVIDTNGTLVIATTDRLIEFDGVSAVEYSSALGNLPSVKITALVIGSDGTRWIGTATDGVLRMQGGAVTSVDLGDDPLTGNHVYTVLVDQQGRVWAGTEHHNNSLQDPGIVMLDDSVWTVWSEANGDNPGSAHAMEMDPNGNVFIAGGTGMFKHNGGSWEEYCVVGGYGFSNSDIAIRNDGTAWLQYYYYTGLAQCDGSTYTNLVTPLGSNMRCVEYDAFGELWVGKVYELARRDAFGNWTVYDDQNQLPSLGTVNDIERDANGVVWVAGNDLYRFDGTTWTFIPNPVTFSWMDDLEIEPGGVIWASLGVDGLARFDGTSWMVWDHTNSPLISDYVTEISLDPARHRLWGATYGGGIFYLEDENLVTRTPGFAELPASLSVYPVPALERVIVRSPGAFAITGRMVIHDALGAMVASLPVNGAETTINVEGWAPGPYSLCLTGDRAQLHGRLVVE